MKWTNSESLGLLLLVSSCFCGGVVEPDVPADYTRLANGGFYKLHREAAAWEEARAACREEGAHLVVVESNAEAAALRRWLRRQRPRLATDGQRTYTLHAGFHVQFLTVLEQPLAPIVLERWRHDEPSSSTCGLIDQEVWMLYGVCAAWLPFICEYPVFTSPPATRAAATAPPTAPPCARKPGDGYERVRGWPLSLYKLHPARTWPVANRTCVEEGAHLVVVDAEAEVEALVDFLRGKRLEAFEKLAFVGALIHEPVTVLGTPLNTTGYNRWLIERQPDWECIAIDRRLLFHSRQCSNPTDVYNFICEKDI